MDDNTILISGQNFATVAEAVDWANRLVGHSSPTDKNLAVKSILEFQVVPDGAGFSMVVMAQIGRKQSMSSMVINMRKDLGLAKDK
jgi:hypothetical protein